jgi:hypothetical protein
LRVAPLRKGGLKKSPKDLRSSRQCVDRACPVFPQNQARLMCNRELIGEIRIQKREGDMTELLRKIWQESQSTQ